MNLSEFIAECPRCEGSGSIRVQDTAVYTTTCPDCGGLGIIGTVKLRQTYQDMIENLKPINRLDT